MSRFPTLVVSLALMWAGICAAQETLTLEQAHKALDADLAALRQKGEPATVDDWPKPQALPAKDNAAVDLRAAAKAVEVDSEAYRLADLMDVARPPRPDQVQILAQVASENERAMQLVASAMGKKVDWQIPPKSPLLKILLPDLAQQRMLANTVRFCTLAAHAEGNDAAALTHVRETLFVARAADEQPFLVSHLVATGISAIAADEAGRIAVDMRQGQRDSAREQCKQTIADLLDETSSDEGLIRALRFERLAQIDTALLIADGKIPAADLGRWLQGQPVALPESEAMRRTALLDARILIEYSGKAIAAISADWPTTKAQLPGRPANSPEHPVVQLLAPSLEKAVRSHFTMLALRRLAAVALAARCYAEDHKGEFPQNLTALVPAYLASVPPDPFAAASALKYDPQRGIVYSLGPDGANSKGTDQLLTQKLR